MTEGRCRPVNTPDRVRRRILITGIVQGVGFRPFVHSLAVHFRLGGFVANDTIGAQIEVEGSAADIAHFIEQLRLDAPPLALIQRIHSEAISPAGENEFAIAPSRQSSNSHSALVSPDIATCADCLQELFDPRDRRYLYPFTNCTNCGPRFTIIRDIPYDRPLTTMAQFEMCVDCAGEYSDPENRRFHAQRISCPACGPQLLLADRSGVRLPRDPIKTAAELLRSGHVLAVKGLGGYHLAAMAGNEPAVAALRTRKYREDKPFAVMVPDTAMALRLAEIDESEQTVLCNSRRPIVLLRRRIDAPLAASVAPANRFVGLMLPYTPLHHLLCRELGSQ